MRESCRGATEISRPTDTRLGIGMETRARGGMEVKCAVQGPTSLSGLMAPSSGAFNPRNDL